MPAALFCLVAAACRGAVPTVNGRPEAGISSVIIGSRIILPAGETRHGKMTVNLEDDDGTEVYRLPLLPQQALFYQVEPGTYHLSPTRSFFGGHQAMLKVSIEGRTYKVPFPRDILRRPPVTVKPRKAVSLGVLEVKLSKALPGREARLEVRLDGSVETRRRLVQDLVRSMMDPAVPVQERESAIAWTRALDQTLLDLLSENERKPLYKLSP